MAKTKNLLSNLDRRAASVEERMLNPHGLDRTEVVTLVARLVCEGYGGGEIQDVLKARYGMEITREGPYTLLAWAASQGWLETRIPHEYQLSELVRERYPDLRSATVVHTSSADDVAVHGARRLFRMVQELSRGPHGRSVVHIGFAGGATMRSVSREFARLLGRPLETSSRSNLPDEVVLHSLVTGIDPKDAASDPNTYILDYVNEPFLRVRTSFVGFRVPSIVSAERFDEMKEWEGIRDSYALRDAIDIFATSASDAQDQHSALIALLGRDPEALGVLREQECVGDVLWQPFGAKGPIDDATAFRIMPLVEPREFPDLIRRGKRVLLALGPCRKCNSPRPEIVRTLLMQDREYVTDLVIDSRSARAILTKPAT